MRLLTFVALVGMAFAAIDDSDYDRIYSEIYTRQIDDTSFRSGREYKYFYDGQIMTGIPGSSKQHSATRIQCIVILQVQNGKSLLKLTHIRMGKLNRKVPNPRAALPFGVFEPVELQSHLLEQLQKPVQFKWERGMVDELILDSKDEPWSVNIKRGVLNMLHLKLKDHGRPDTELNQIETGFSKHYRTLEKTLEGECEVLYTVESLPSLRYQTGRPVLNVTKSINFEDCQNRPELKYNWRFHQECPSCDPKFQEDEKSLKSSTVIKYNITGDREQYLIETVKVESQYLLVPFNEEANVIASYVNQTLVLFKTGPIQTSIEQIRSPMESQSDLVYSLRWEEWKEKFYMEGDKTFHSRNPYSQISNKLEVISDLIYKLIKYMEKDVKVQAPKYFDRLVSMLRMCNKQELEEIHNHFFKGVTSKLSSTEEKKRAKDIIVNAVALAGTKECLSHIIHHIENGELSPLRAASALRQFHQARVVSPKMIQEMKKLCENSRVRETYLLKQACYLTVGSLMYQACGDQEKDQMAMDVSQYYAKTAGGARDQSSVVCTESQKREFVNWMWTKFEEASNVEDRILIVKMIGNSGLQGNIQKLEKIIHQKSESRVYHPKTRIAAISAIRLLIDTIPKKVQRVLVPIMLNKYEDPEIRIASAYFMLQTYPDRFLLNMITKDLNVEPSFQYRSYLWTYLNDLANSTNPCFKELSTNLKLSLRFAHNVDKTFTSSKIRKLSFYSEMYKTGFDFEPLLIMSNTSFMPRQVGINLAQTGFGFIGKWATSFGVSSNGLDQLLWKFLGPSGWLHERSWLPWQQTPTSSSNTGSSQSARWANELKGIYDSMKVSKSYYRNPTRDPMAYFYYRYLGQDLFYYPAKTSFLKKLTEEGFTSLKSHFDLSHITRMLNEPFDISYATLLTDFKHKIPTTLGLPITIKYKTPLVANIKGKLEVPQLNGDLRSLALNIHVKPSIAVKRIESVEIWCPVVNNGLKVEIEGKLFTPIKAVIKPELANHEKILKVTFEPPTETRELALLQSRPITYTRQWPQSLKLWLDPEEKTVYGLEHNRIKSIDRSYFESLFGVKLQVKGRVHWTPMVKLANTPFVPYSGPNKLVVEIKPGFSVPQKIELIFKGKFGINGFEAFSPEMSYSPEWLQESSSSDSSEIVNLMRPTRVTRGKRSTTNLESTESSQQQQQSSSSSSSSERTNNKYKWRADRKHEFSVMMKTVGASQERKVELKCDFSYSPYLHFMKLNGKVHVSPLPKYTTHPYSTCFKGEIVYPNSPMSAKSVYDKKIKGEMKINFAPTPECPAESSSSFIKATLQAERSSRQLEAEVDNYEYWQCRQSLKPVACQQYLSKAGEMKKYVLNINYKDVPVVVKNITNKLWLALKHKYFWQTDIAQIKVHNPEDQIKAIIRLDPFTDRHLNITVKTPRENVTMYDIPLPFYVRPLNVKRSTMKQYYENTMFGRDAPICEINENRVKTFDEVEFGFRLSNCWTVLAKDCSNERSFAVLAKRMSESEEKAVKILTPYGKVKLTKKPNHNQIILEKDGQAVTMKRDEPIEIVQHGHVVVIVKLEDEMNVRVYLPEQQVKVYFDGFNVHVKMQTPLYMGRQCGICGNMDFDSNPETEFYRLDSNNLDYYETEYNTRKAFHSYTIKDDSCSRPENYEEMCENEMCIYNRNVFPDNFRTIRDPFDLPEKYDYRSEITPTRKTRKIERHGKLCFSTRPIPTCPSHSYPVGIKKTEEVTFKCQPKYSSYWGTYDSSSSSSSSTEESTESNQQNSRLVSSASSSSAASSETSSSIETIQRRQPRAVPALKTTHNVNKLESSSGSDSTSSSSSSERFLDSVESGNILNEYPDMETTIRMTVTIPESCRRI